MTLHSEIFEQPQSLASLLENQKQTVLEIARAIQSRNVQYAFLAARGTSDNAGRYANYLWGAITDFRLRWRRHHCSRIIKVRRV